MRTLPSLSEVREANSSFPYSKPMQEWKDQGKKVIGWICTYVPEEIIHAAGFLPVRLTGDVEELPLGEATSHLYHTTCTPMRTCFQLALDGKYGFLDGFAHGSACDQSRRLFDMWCHFTPTPFAHSLHVPGRLTEKAETLYRKEVVKFKEHVEEFFGVKITTDALRNSIAIYDETRRLLRQLYDLGKLDSPPVTGAEHIEILNAAVRMPKEQFNPLLRKLLQEARERAGSSAPTTEGTVRLMMNGAMLNNPQLVELVEELGGRVVVDEHCTTIHYFWDLVDLQDSQDPIEALSRRYFFHWPCARMHEREDRFERVMSLVKEYRVQGVISDIIRYCATYAFDQPALKDELESKGIPLLQLDIEYGVGKSGQIKTRVQAFLEMIRGD